jgi:hypothetical protein
VIIFICKQLAMIDPEMMEIEYIKHVIAALTVGVNDPVKLNFAGNYRD